MRKFLVILGFLATFWAFSSQADEEFDPAVFPEQAENEARANEGLPPVTNTSPTPMAQNALSSSSISPTAGGSVIRTPKFVDDEELNFDDVGNAFGEEEAKPAPAAAVDIPLLQKSEVQLNPNAAPTSGEAPAAPTEVQVDAAQPLTDNLKDNEAQLPLPKTGGTWINKLTTTTGNVIAPQKSATSSSTPTADANLEAMIDKAKTRNQRSNASVFDISGAMLRMSFLQIDETLTRRGFRRTVQKLDIPNFIRWRNEDKCRASGVVGYERLENCVIKLSQRDKLQYVETASYAKYDTKENIEVKFTSTFTNNKAYKISYKSEAAINISGNSQKAIYLRNIKVYDFWKKINQKYGNPDNRDDVIWGLGGNKPYLQAATGRLVLEDPMLRELDYTRMSREDQRFMNTDLYSF